MKIVIGLYSTKNCWGNAFNVLPQYNFNRADKNVFGGGSSGSGSCRVLDEEVIGLERLKSETEMIAEFKNLEKSL